MPSTLPAFSITRGVLKPPLQRVGNGEIALFAGFLQKFLGDVVRFDFIDRQVPVVHQADEVFRVAAGFQMLPNQLGHREIGGAAVFNEDVVQDVQRGGGDRRIVLLVVDEDQQVITEPEDLLACRLERARGLRLRDGRNLHIYIKVREINAHRGIARGEPVFPRKLSPKFVLKVLSRLPSHLSPHKASVPGKWIRLGRIPQLHGGEVQLSVAVPPSTLLCEGQVNARETILPRPPEISLHVTSLASLHPVR